MQASQSQALILYYQSFKCLQAYRCKCWVDAAKNAGILAAQMIAISNTEVRERVVAFKKEQHDAFLPAMMHSFNNEYDQYKKDH